MKCKQTLFLALTVALLFASISSSFASVTIPKRPIFFPFNNGAYLTFSTTILPLTFSGNPQSVYRDTVNRWHFGTTWITSTTSVTITAWFSSDWLNYTVASSGTQQVSNGSKPTAVFLDGVFKTEGDGWSYYSGTITAVTGATTSVALYWGSSVVSVIILFPTNTTYTSTIPVQLSASGGTIDTIWWNCKNDTTWIYGTNQTYTVPTNMTDFMNGTSYTFYGWANNTDGFIGESTVGFSVQTLIVNWHIFAFNFYDLDTNDVENHITWQLYNSTQLLTYTEGQATLLAGTYTLKTYYHVSLINQTDLDTATYGNTTVHVYLQLKPYAYGYLAFNNTVTGLILHNQSMYNLTFTLYGSVPITMTTDFPYSPTYISKDGANQTGWTYTSGHVVLTASSLNVWSLIYEPSAPTPPLPAPTEIQNFLAFLLAGDFLGFIMAVYTQGFGSVDIFFGVVIMLVMVPLYIRTKSLMFMSILWILLGSLFLVAIPLVSGLAVLLLVLGIGSMLFEIFMINRRG